MPDIFDILDTQDTQISGGDIFDKTPLPPQSFRENISRSLGAAATGYASGTGYGLLTNLSNLLALGDVYDPEEIERIRAISEREGVPFDEEQYLEAGGRALGSFPTPSNIARMTEESTGLPITAKNKLQKAIELGTMAGKVTPGTVAQRGTAAIAAPVSNELLQELGLPEELSELASLGIGSYAGSKAPKIDITKSKKTSGLIERRYEKLKKPTEVSPGKIKKINEKIENEFRNIASDIIEKSPIEETYSSLKNDVTFKEQAKKSFKDVENLSETLPEKFSTKEIKKSLTDILGKKKGKGFTPSEYDVSHKKFINDFIKKTPEKEINTHDLVSQYRRNNESLAEAYEPGQSFAYNKAKREALSDYNKIIAETIESKFPDSEFSNLFKSTNKQWSQIMDAEAIDKFMDKLFDGKIKFEKGKDFFNKEGMTLPFKRALGEEGFKNFQQLMKDLMSTEQASKMMKAARTKGFKDLGETAFSFVLHPTLGKLKLGYEVAKDAYIKLWEAVLDKPQLAVTWDNGLKEFKKGNFANAEKAFNELKEKSEKIRIDSMHKFKEKMKSNQKFQKKTNAQSLQ